MGRHCHPSGFHQVQLRHAEAQKVAASRVAAGVGEGGGVIAHAGDPPEGKMRIELVGLIDAGGWLAESEILVGVETAVNGLEDTCSMDRLSGKEHARSPDRARGNIYGAPADDVRS